MEGRFLLLVAMATVLQAMTLAVPLKSQTYPEVVEIGSTGFLEPEVVVGGGITGSGGTPDLREGAVDASPLNPEGCLDQKGSLRKTGTSWNVGCAQTCECVSTPEGPITHCGDLRCAIPMLSPGCEIVQNPKRNNTSGENCCDVVECTPVYCLDNRGGKHEVYSSWRDGELDCYCGYNFQRDAPEPHCSLVEAEIPTTTEATPNEVYPPAERSYRTEFLVNEADRTFDVYPPEELGSWPEPMANDTNETMDVCVDDNGSRHGVGQTWRIGCHTECQCVRKGEITTARCSPFPCPVPMLLPGCWISPNPQRDTANSLHCCDIVTCPPKLCLGRDQRLYELNSVWYENNEPCTCVLNYNVNQAVKTCGTMNEPSNV